MEPFSCLAIDMGAGSIRIIQGIFNDRFTLNEVYRFENECTHIDGHYRWNIDQIGQKIIHGIRLAFSQTNLPILSVGVDSWGVDFVLLGQNGEFLEHPVTYRDSRTEGMKAFWNKTKSDYDTFVQTGINYNIFNSLYQFLSIQSSKTLQKTKHILFMADYINYLLSGKIANELTLASTTQLLNIGTKEWDSEITTLLGINKKLSTPIAKAGQKLGALLAIPETKTELIATAGHDTACAVASIPNMSENLAFISTGTWCIVGYISNEPVLSYEAFTAGITNEICYDGKIRPLTNVMGLWLIQQLRKAFGQKHSYDEIENMAQNESANTDLIDTNDPIFFNPSNMQEAFDTHLTRNEKILPNSEAAYYSCAYKSIAVALSKKIFQIEEIANKSFTNIRLI
ncbi:MAG TPA: FGGY family carbohydrate kinase, partial [Prolixibacteraceae bacterium]|nr:FGGY family carbohydrate kinase [Prolixibacteraceae bacterium]